MYVGCSTAEATGLAFFFFFVTNPRMCVVNQQSCLLAVNFSILLPPPPNQDVHHLFKAVHVEWATIEFGLREKFRLFSTEVKP